MGKQSSFRKEVTKCYGLPGDERHLNNNRVWNIVSGGWEHHLPHHAHGKEQADVAEVKLDTKGATKDERQGGILQAAHIVPQCFGKKMFRRIFGDAYHDEDFWAPRNGLLLPRGIASAMDDWSITVVPKGNSGDWSFRVIDATDTYLSRRITFTRGDTRTGRDLDGVELSFSTPFRPGRNYLYFNHCCAIVKKNRSLFRDDATDKCIQQFRIEQAGEGGKKSKFPPLTREYDLQSFWRGMLEDLVRMDENPERTKLDWSMDLRYLKKAEESEDETSTAQDEVDVDDARIEQGDVDYKDGEIEQAHDGDCDDGEIEQQDDVDKSVNDQEEVISEGSRVKSQ